MQLRPATSYDYTQRIAELIWSEDPALMLLEFKSFEIWEKVVAVEWLEAAAANSYATTVLAFAEGQVSGLINAFPSTEIKPRMEFSEGLSVGSQLSDDQFDHIDALFPSPPAQAYYILDIAVHAAQQAIGARVQIDCTS